MKETPTTPDIYEQLFTMAARFYPLSVYELGKQYHSKKEQNHGIRIRNMELYLINVWIKEKYLIWCWTELCWDRKYRPFYKSIKTHSQKKIKLPVCSSHEEGLCLALIEVLKTI